MAWQKGETQQVLILLHLILNREHLTNGQRVEATLPELRSYYHELFGTFRPSSTSD